MTTASDSPPRHDVVGRACSCWRTPSEKIEVVVFGADLHLRALEKRGPPYWWIRAAVCDPCGQHWLIAQEERLNDVYLLRKLNAEEASALLDRGIWPTDFDRYAALLTICEAAGHSWRGWDRSDTSVLAAAHVLRQECPGISLEEISTVLGLGAEDASRVAASFEAIDASLA